MEMGITSRSGLYKEQVARVYGGVYVCVYRVYIFVVWHFFGFDGTQI